MFYLIITLCLSSALIQSVVSKEIAINVNNLTTNHIIDIDNEDMSHRLDIFCSFGQNISVLNVLMSSHFQFIQSPPQDIQLITSPYLRHKNTSQIIKHFRKKWSQMNGWFDTTVATNITIPSFNVYCIAIVSKESYKCQLLVTRVDINRLVSLSIGLMLFIFGPHLSRSILFYYTSCIALGVFASFLVIFVIMGRYFPRKISGIIIMLGTSAMMFAFRIFWQSLHHFLIDHSFYVIIYIFLMAFISFGAAYRFGPVTNHKTLNLMQWLLQSIGLLLMTISSELYEYSLLFIVIVIALKVLPMNQMFSYKRTEKLKLRLLSEHEFELQSDVQTREALQQLKKFCISSECNAWNTICKLKDPIRFARFIDGENHISDDEIIAYESSQMNNSLIALNHNNNEDDSDDEYQELQ